MHFEALFTRLFGGGRARLALTDQDDPFAAGLELAASPPGKKLQSVSLLSGGEKALTALALIFAVFLTKPARLCVLDEVDAPLDDANVERLMALLEELARGHPHALSRGHPPPADHGAHAPPVRRDHGRARHLAAGLGRSDQRGRAARHRLTRTARLERGRSGFVKWTADRGEAQEPGSRSGHGPPVDRRSKREPSMIEKKTGQDRRDQAAERGRRRRPRTRPGRLARPAAPRRPLRPSRQECRLGHGSGHPTGVELQARIRQRAYELWESDGRPRGVTTPTGMQAEREIGVAGQRMG